MIQPGISIADHNPVIRHLFTADPSVLAMADTIYLYTGHDEPPPAWKIM